jgi:recombination DNA repair RAD52 pathway protein
MNKFITGLLLAGIISTPIAANANSDSDYPAANFQPKVIFSDDSISSSSTHQGEKSSFDPDYPAASFQPKVLYVDASSSASTTEANFGEKSTFDPKYPAANFEPKVIYP